MQIAQEGRLDGAAPGTGVAEDEAGLAPRPAFADYKIIRRNGAVVGFEPAKISVAMTKAYLAVGGSQGAASARVRELVAQLTDSVVAALVRRQPQGGTFHIEDIQDQVELARAGVAGADERLLAVLVSGGGPSKRQCFYHRANADLCRLLAWLQTYKQLGNCWLKRSARGSQSRLSTCRP
mgnify:CR=1 FL=1